MPAPIACGAGDGRPHVGPGAVPPPASCAGPARRLPASALDRVAPPRTVRAGPPLRALAHRRRPPLCAPAGAWRPWRPETQRALRQRATERAEGCQRARATVAGRHGERSLRTHPLRGRALPRQRTGLPTLHPFFRTRSDGPTAAARCCGPQPRAMCAAIVDSVDLPPAPRSPQRIFCDGRRDDRDPICRDQP